MQRHRLKETPTQYLAIPNQVQRLSILILSRLSNLIEEEYKDKSTTPDKHDLESKEFSLASATIEEGKMDPLDYWVGKLKHFPITLIAYDSFAVPASPVSVYTMDFSTGGDTIGGKRNRSTQKFYIEREIFS